ncbi:coenzyme PQQ precursor peptide PqqA [Thiopseudomonas denitrificans]|uniref:Coenzyme PQQ synthesis protein A n=1 Tax=Thiopseudomonas denitrificans TaxID=1501432 RepID=A0A4R6TWC8_9GAMM|nr:coenzyme PQQ precursor peptide PqqA [Thiopseudomonas denitrificans]
MQNGTKVLFGRGRLLAINNSPDQSGIDNNNEDTTMWTKPAYNDLRIGFEVTMYINNR